MELDKKDAIKAIRDMKDYERHNLETGRRPLKISKKGFLGITTSTKDIRPELQKNISQLVYEARKQESDEKAQEKQNIKDIESIKDETFRIHKDDTTLNQDIQSVFDKIDKLKGVDINKEKKNN